MKAQVGVLQRRCSGCGEVRPLGWFRRAGVTRAGTPKRYSRCRECERPGKVTGDRLRRRRLKSQREGVMTAAAIRRLGEAQGWRCGCGCGRVIRWAYHVDHIRPLSKGGVHGLRNVQLLAPGCNLRKSARWEGR